MDLRDDNYKEALQQIGQPAFYPGEMFPVFAEIMAERAHQDEVWGGAEHDSQHCSWDFCNYIEKYIRKLHALDDYTLLAATAPERRRRMVQIAALACAALQHCPDLQPPTDAVGYTADAGEAQNGKV